MVEAAAHSGVRAQLCWVDGFGVDKMASALYDLQEQVDAVGLVGFDHPQIREAIATLRRVNIPVAALVTDVPGCIGYVGIDNRCAGRLAGLLLGRFLGEAAQSAEVAVFAGSMAYRGHQEREMGFRSFLAEEFPELRISRLLEISDDRDIAYETTRALFREQAPQAIYNVGAGNDGIARALDDLGLSRQVVFIGHELTDSSRRLLLNRTMDAVIDQNPRVEAREIIRLLTSTVRGRTEPSYLPRLQVIFRENIPTQ